MQGSWTKYMSKLHVRTKWVIFGGRSLGTSYLQSSGPPQVSNVTLRDKVHVRSQDTAVVGF